MFVDYVMNKYVDMVYELYGMLLLINKAAWQLLCNILHSTLLFLSIVNCDAKIKIQ